MSIKHYFNARLRLYGRRALVRLGFDLYQTDRWYRGNDDRRLLETQILPYYAGRSELNDLLFVGAQWYTRGYRRLFKGCNYRVIEIDPIAARRYGGTGAIAASCTDVARWVPEQSLDLIIFTGVFGYGLDRRDELEQAFSGFFHCLRPGGELLFGFDGVPWHCPFNPLESTGLRLFESLDCPVFGSDQIVSTDSWRKTYCFLRRPIN